MEEAFLTTKSAHNPTLEIFDEIHRSIFDQCFAYTRAVFKATNLFLFFGFTFGIVIGTIVNAFASGTAYPLPFPFYVGFQPPSDGLTYALNLGNQVSFFLFIIVKLWMGLPIIFSIAIYNVQYTEVIIQLIRKKEELGIDYQTWLKLTMDAICENRK